MLLTSTGATSIMLEHGDVEPVVDARAGRPLLIVDIAVPRDVDPAAGDPAGRHAARHGRPAGFAEAGVAERRREVDAVRAIVDDELERFHERAPPAQVAPLVAALRERAEPLRQAELGPPAEPPGRPRPRPSSEAVEALTTGLVAKLLHEPTVALKDAAGHPQGERLAEALRDLFDL